MNLQAGGAVLAVDEDFGLVAAHGLLTHESWGLRRLGRPEKKEEGDLSRSILSSGLAMRRVCYARASWRRFCKRRRRDRKGANVFIAGGYFIRRAGCQAASAWPTRSRSPPRRSGSGSTAS